MPRRRRRAPRAWVVHQCVRVCMSVRECAASYWTGGQRRQSRRRRRSRSRRSWRSSASTAQPKSNGNNINHSCSCSQRRSCSKECNSRCLHTDADSPQPALAQGHGESEEEEEVEADQLRWWDVATAVNVAASAAAAAAAANVGSITAQTFHLQRTASTGLYASSGSSSAVAFAVTINGSESTEQILKADGAEDKQRPKSAGSAATQIICSIDHRRDGTERCRRTLCRRTSREGGSGGRGSRLHCSLWQATQQQRHSGHCGHCGYCGDGRHRGGQQREHNNKSDNNNIRINIRIRNCIRIRIGDCNHLDVVWQHQLSGVYGVLLLLLLLQLSQLANKVSGQVTSTSFSPSPYRP